MMAGPTLLLFVLYILSLPALNTSLLLSLSASSTIQPGSSLNVDLQRQETDPSLVTLVLHNHLTGESIALIEEFPVNEGNSVGVITIPESTSAHPQYVIQAFAFGTTTQVGESVAFEIVLSSSSDALSPTDPFAAYYKEPESTSNAQGTLPSSTAPSKSTHSRLPIGIVVGSVFLGLLGLISFSLLLWFYLRKRRIQENRREIYKTFALGERWGKSMSARSVLPSFRKHARSKAESATEPEKKQCRKVTPPPWSVPTLPRFSADTIVIAPDCESSFLDFEPSIYRQPSYMTAHSRQSVSSEKKRTEREKTRLQLEGERPTERTNLFYAYPAATSSKTRSPSRQNSRKDINRGPSLPPYAPIEPHPPFRLPVPGQSRPELKITVPQTMISTHRSVRTSIPEDRWELEYQMGLADVELQRLQERQALGLGGPSGAFRDSKATMMTAPAPAVIASNRRSERTKRKTRV